MYNECEGMMAEWISEQCLCTGSAISTDALLRD